MRQPSFLRLSLTALLLCIFPLVSSHGHDEPSGAGMDMHNALMPIPIVTSYHPSPDEVLSYFRLDAEKSPILAHIVFMVLAWFFVLPIGLMLSVASSRLALPGYLTFTVLNALGVLFGIIYNTRTPDLYQGNAHHRIGWIGTWVMAAQVIMGLVFVYSRRTKHDPATVAERATFLPISVEVMIQHLHQEARRIVGMHQSHWFGDSRKGTERTSSSLHSRDNSPTRLLRALELDDKHESDRAERGDDDVLDERRYLKDSFIHRFLPRRTTGPLSPRLLRSLEVVYCTIDRLVPFLGYTALVTGAITYGGICRGDAIFNGLAHFIKGGIFFWYGILTLSRWMGCFADSGWAWNVKPSKSIVGQWRASIPSAEFTESFVIFLYGLSNVFLEQLAARGGAWAAQDLEHVSISIMFFGGGLCGMLVDSKRVHGWLNTSLMLSSKRMHINHEQSFDAPTSYRASGNPLPALVILLLGLLMSGHHQDSGVSTIVHKQWGMLLVGFALARGVTYILLYVLPPASLLPSRPPSELITSFCLISASLVFQLSNKDVVAAIESYGLNAMFTFTLSIGFTAFLMAWEIIVVATKGWATGRERPAATSVGFQS